MFETFKNFDLPAVDHEFLDSVVEAAADFGRKVFYYAHHAFDFIFEYIDTVLEMEL